MAGADRDNASLLDPDVPTIVSIWGRKRSGKSVLAGRLWRTYPYDRVCIDPTGDADVGPRDDRRDPIITLHGTGDDIPTTFPAHPDGRRRSVVYEGDVGSKTYQDDLDRAVGLALHHPDRRCLLWVDEVGDVTSGSYTPPNMRRLLHKSRHYGVSGMFCGPRPMDVNRLVLAQSDYVYCFDLPIPEDRERVAKTIGYPPREFDEVIFDLPEHGFCRWDANAKELVIFPPLPLRPNDITRTDGGPTRTASFS